MTFTTPIFATVFAVLVLIIIVAHFVMEKRRSNLLELSQVNKNYYVLTDVGTSESAELQSEIDKLQKTWRMLSRILTVFIVLIVIATTLLYGRPGSIEASQSDAKSRDIVLCLDVSGSVLTTDKQILQSYKQIVSNFTGERIAFQIFDSTSRTVFPLTDDYSQVQTLLDSAISTLNLVYNNTNLDSLSVSDRKTLMSFLAGTTSRIDSASLIGDGLINCSLQFGDFSSNRSRSLIFATDNVMSGNPIFSINNAASMINKRGIKLYTIFSGKHDQEGKADELNLREMTQSINGEYYAANSTTSVDLIVNQIQEKEKVELLLNNQWTIFDHPHIILYFLIPAFFGYLLISWRLKR
ncbi:MAG: VWA domain-containing protein [Candidatus Ancillula sp.]|jgi:hypothetical protein|nr:VWA domain-containing protein [Candidatus Ancillula sp.]